jgi:arsenite-transporting ATPase
VKNLLPRLRNPDFTKVLLISLPEATPVHEAIQLQCDLQRAEIQPYAWVINQSLTPLQLQDPVLRARQASESRYIEQVCRNHAQRIAMVPWVGESPHSLSWFRQLVSQTCGAPSPAPKPTSNAASKSARLLTADYRVVGRDVYGE